MRCLFALLSFAAVTCAFQILTPTIDVGWTTAGPNNLTWTWDSDDPLTFPILLVNWLVRTSLSTSPSTSDPAHS